mgnify:CR=1 FL=1
MKLTKSQIKELIRHSIRELTSEREDVTESKKRRFTVKEVRMWMKKLEENRYKKVYNSDARRVAWMVNNEGRTLDEMPISMKKKWTKAQYGRERYLATEFLKSKSEQMNEGKLTEAIKKVSDAEDGAGFRQDWIGIYKGKFIQFKANFPVDAKKHTINHFKVPKSKYSEVVVISKKEYDIQQQLKVEQKLREQIREIIKEQLNEQKFKKVILPNDMKTKVKVSKMIKQLKLKIDKDYDVKALKARGGDQVISILPKHYNKFIELAMKNKLNPRG